MFSSRSVCIGGLPGLGSVGKVAADYLATSLECKPVKSFFSRGFPAQIMISDGLAYLLQAELKAPKDREGLLIFSGDAQPLEIREMYCLAGEVLEEARSRGSTDFIALAAYLGEAENKVLGAASDSEAARQLEAAGLPLLRNGAIGGLNGLLAGLAPLYGMRGFCLLGTTTGEIPVDLRATRNLLQTLLPLLDMDISIEDLPFEELEEAIQEEPDMNYR
jgi:proteasome assembly chaperone (PAC2) family protein